MDTNITIVTFNGELHTGEEQMFRGAFIKEMGERATPLFHNHTVEGLRFSYPLIQYKLIDHKPTIVGIGKGGAALMDISREYDLMIGKKPRHFEVENINIMPYSPELYDEPKFYSLSRYIPFNHENEEKYLSLPALTDRINFMEDLINANILSFFKGIDYHCEEQIQTAISSIEKVGSLYYKGIKFRGFDLTFISNVVLPDKIGIGKSPSVGFGIIKKIAIPKRYLSKLTGVE